MFCFNVCLEVSLFHCDLFQLCFTVLLYRVSWLCFIMFHSCVSQFLQLYLMLLSH